MGFSGVGVDRFAYRWRVTGSHAPLTLPLTTSWVLTQGGQAGFSGLGLRRDSTNQDGAKGADGGWRGHCFDNRRDWRDTRGAVGPWGPTLVCLGGFRAEKEQCIY